MKAIEARLRKVALSYPETYEESPWGDRVVKVKGKIFFFCGERDGELHLSVKLPQSGRAVLKNAFARPTPYGLGKSGWVSCTFTTKKSVNEKQIAAWIDEGYRAIAPKKLAASLPPLGGPLRKAPAVAKRAVAAPKAARPKTKKRVLLLCGDELRAERAQRALLERGVPMEIVDDVNEVRARVKKKKVDAVIVDIGRQKDKGIALAEEIDASDAPIFLFVVGMSGGWGRKRVDTTLSSADFFKDPPGDPAVADAIAKALLG
jgi:predicted DNA-binding protein (MmcQ/YjbR family)